MIKDLPAVDLPPLEASRPSVVEISHAEPRRGMLIVLRNIAKHTSQGGIVWIFGL